MQTICTVDAPCKLFDNTGSVQKTSISAFTAVFNVLQHTYGSLHCGHLLYLHEPAATHFLQLTPTKIGSGIGQNALEDGRLVVWAVGSAYELHLHTALTEYYLLASQHLAKPAQCHHLHQFLALVGHGTETVDEAQTIGFQLLLGLKVVELAVEQHTLAASRHIAVGEIHTQIAL